MEAVKTVLSGFIGIRRKSAHEDAKLNPLHIIIVAIACLALFIATLATIVHFVTR